MTRLEETVLSLQRKLPALSKRAIYDTTPDGEDFCELVYPNPYDSAYPLTLCVYEDGAVLSFGYMENITGEDRLPTEQMVSEIKNILSDKFMFVFCYESQEKKDSARISKSLVFDMETQGEEYEKFLTKIKTPLNKFSRYFAMYKGIFVIRNFSGSVNFEIER